MGDIIAVAGATGNAGRELIRAAHARGLSVRALARTPEKLGADGALCAEVRKVRVTEPDSLAGCLDGARFVVSALGKTRQKDRLPRRLVDVEANRNVFAEAARAGVGRLGMISVMGADPQSDVAVLRMKGEAEDAMRSSGLPSVAIRPNGFFSDMADFLEMAKRGTVWGIGDVDARFNPIGLGDLGRFTIDALLDDARAGQTLPVGGPELLSTRDIAAAAGRALGRDVRVRALPVWAMRATLATLRPFSRNAWELGCFFLAMAERAIAGEASLPPTGDQRLEDFFRTLVAPG